MWWCVSISIFLPVGKLSPEDPSAQGFETNTDIARANLKNKTELSKQQQNNIKLQN